MKAVVLLQLVILMLVNADSNLGDYSTKPSTMFIKTCCDLRPFPVSSGVYKISTGTFSTTNVYCDMTTNNGGWIVIQRNRKDSRLNFNKNWKEYEEGFGDLNGDFWAGLKLMHALTQSGQWEMRVDYQQNDKSWTNLRYNHFSVQNATSKYQLDVREYTGAVSFGPGGDPFTGKNHKASGMKFTTRDQDNDIHGNNHNCARQWLSGWWYRECYHININRQPPHYAYPNAALFTEMKIRPKDCIV